MPDEFRDMLRQAYDNGAIQRKRSPLPAWKHKERSNFLSRLQDRKCVKLLEVGAGTGRDSRYFADAGCEVTCVDLSPAMVALCRQKGLNASVMDVAHLSFENASFEAVYSFNSLLHLPKVELPAVLLEIRRVLVPGGVFYFGTYGGYNHAGVYEDDNYTPRRFFSFFEDALLQHVVGQCFEILSFQSLQISDPRDRLRFQSLLLQRPST